MKITRLPVLGLVSVLVSAATATLAQSAPSLPQPSQFLFASLSPSSSSSSSSSEFASAPDAAVPAAPASAAFAAASQASSAKMEPSPGAHPFSAVGVGVTVGTGGIGFNVATPLILGRLNLRGGAGFFSYTYSGTIDNEPVNATLKLDNAEVMVDLFPFKGSFRLSAGTTVYNTTGLNGTVTVSPGTTLKIGSDTYLSAPSPNPPLTGTLNAAFGGKAVPRFTLGWGNMVPRTGHVKFETEIGVEVIGTPTVGWNYGGNACLDNNGAGCTNYQPINSISTASADIASQTASLKNDVNGLKVFPIFSLGLSFKIP